MLVMAFDYHYVSMTSIMSEKNRKMAVILAVRAKNVPKMGLSRLINGHLQNNGLMDMDQSSPQMITLCH